MKNIVLIAFVLFLLSCSSEPDEEVKQAESSEKEQPHLLSDQQKAMEKAKEVEKKLQEADEKRRKALEDQ